MEILDSIGIDQTIFWQFIIFVITFVSLKKFLFEKLQEVVEEREYKTVSLAKIAEDKEQEALKISNEIETEITLSKKQANEKLRESKKVFTLQEDKKIKSAEDRLNENLEKKKEEFSVTIEEKRAGLISQAEDLSNELVHQMTQ